MKLKKKQFKMIKTNSKMIKETTVKETSKKASNSQNKPSKKGKGNKLPNDEYEPLFKPIRSLVRETKSYKDNSSIKQYIEISVKKIDDNLVDEATNFLFIQMYQESNFYTGYLKGKTVYLPLANSDNILESIYRCLDKAEEIGIPTK